MARPIALPALPPHTSPTDRRRVVGWHLAWTAGVALLAVAVIGLTGPPSLPLGLALVVAALPGPAALMLTRRDTTAVRALLLGIWALSAMASATLTGGLSGPLPGLVFMPAVAGLVLARRPLTAAGIAAALLSAVCGLISILVVGPAIPVDGLPALGLVVCALAGGTAVQMRLSRLSDETRRSARDARDLGGLLDGLPTLALAILPSGRVIQAHGRAPAPMSIEALVTDGLIAAVHGPDRSAVLSAMEKTLAGTPQSTRFTPAAELDRRIDLFMRRADAPDGAVRILAVAMDGTIPHRRELEQEAARLAAESRSEGKTRFLATMSHELRTPLNAVLGFSDIMRQRIFGPLPDRYADYAGSIHEAGGHLLNLVNDVLDVSKLEAERYELAMDTFDARDVVSAALALVRVQASDGGVTTSALLPGHGVTVHADRRALNQILVNLLSNAVKFTAPGGTVSVGLALSDDGVVLTVADTGVGIAAEDMARLGRPFEQAGGARQKKQGTGLGLALVKALAERHGGRMTVESRPGVGTAVTVSLPILASASRQPA